MSGTGLATGRSFFHSISWPNDAGKGSKDSKNPLSRAFFSRIDRIGGEKWAPSGSRVLKNWTAPQTRP
jgi:hypothetical protein